MAAIVQVPFTLIRFQTKAELFCSVYGYRPHYNAENVHRSGAIWKRCFFKTLFSSEDGENNAIWKRWRHQPGARPLDREYPKWRTNAIPCESISRQFRGPIYLNAHASSSLNMCMRRVHWTCACVEFIYTEGIRVFSKRIRRCSVDGWKRYENDKCGRKSFWKRSKTAPFSFENGLVWTGPQSWEGMSFVS